MHRTGWFALLALLSIATPCAAEVSQRGSLTLLVENDVFFRTDRDYTNGLEFVYSTPADDQPDWLIDIARRMPFFQSQGSVRASYAIGQNIYTPEDIELYDPPKTEHPYGGFLYGAVGLTQNFGNTLDQLQIQLGMIGPASLAGTTQTWFHGLFRFHTPMGWHTELRDEPGLAIIYERSFRNLASAILMPGIGLGVDLQPHIGGAVGNVYDYLNAGVMVRVGLNLPDDYGPIRIQPGLPGANFFDDDDSFSVYMFGGADGRAVARNIFLDGNTWQDSRSVVKKNLVGDFEIGAAARYGRFRLAFTHVFRSREFATQTNADQFGAISLSYLL